MATENTVRFRNAARSYSKRARILISHNNVRHTDKKGRTLSKDILPVPPIGSIIKDSHDNTYHILDDGSIRHKYGKKNSRRDNIRRFGKFMGKASDELRREVNELATAI